jgi:radical SAM enzyme (TIGR01210 family)
MSKLETQIHKIRQKSPLKDHNTRKFIGCWSEKDVLDDEIVEAFVIVLRTRGCAWALKCGCTMCGYINDCVRDSVSSEDIIFQFNQALEQLRAEHKIVKLFTSGSFIDDTELDEKTQLEILSTLNTKTDKVLFETRPEFITHEKLSTLKSAFGDLELAIGLESANNYVLEHSINKGFKFEDYLKGAKLILENDLTLKTYLLIKPPFLTERESIEDAVMSVQKLHENNIDCTISFNPVHIQNYTLVERLWYRNEFRPPWLWSVVEVLKRSKELTDLRLMSAPTAGGNRRGAHNCGKCDQDLLAALTSFSLSGDIDELINLDCDCREKWLDIIELEGFAQSGGVALN